MSDNIQRLIDFTHADIRTLKKHPLKNMQAIANKQRFIKTIQAMSEGQRDILNTRITNFSGSTGKEIDKNNFANYESQVNGIYEMYEARSTYGAEMAGGIVDTRAAFISGEGLSIISENETTQKYIEDFIEKNKLNGSRLMTMVTTAELEGCNLVTLKPYKPAGNRLKWHIKARSFSWYENKYKIILNASDTDEIEEVVYKDKTEQHKEQKIKSSDCVYVKIGGTERKIDETTNRIHRVLTNIENMSRGIYDLRNNTHLFGRVMPYWKTESQVAAAAINTSIESGQFAIGKGYAGNADFKFIEPTGSAGKSVLDDIMINLKVISSTTGIPVHFLAWPDLLSNRATADTLIEVVKAATQKERLIWEEAFHEIIEKSMQLAIDSGIATNEILKGKFTVRLPLVSIALLKQLIEIWEPLRVAGIISDFTMLNMLPGINPAEEKERTEEEQEERAKNSMLNNGTINETINNMQNKNKRGKEDIDNGNDED